MTPFASGMVRDVVVDRYQQLLDEYDSEELLVLTGSPTSMGTFRTLLDDVVPGAAVPRVTSLVVQATEVVNKTDDRTILSDTLRRELVHRFLEDYDWECDYLHRAAQQPSFAEDIGGLMETATWQNAALDTTRELEEITSVRDAFHEWLANHDHMVRGQLINEATSVLEDPDQRNDIVDASAILAVEFEEFLPPDRRYLQTISDGVDLVCVAETDASIRRTRMESGSLADQVSFTDEETLDREDITRRPEAAAAYWARGIVPDDPERGQVNVLATETSDEQLHQVADEIERLRETEEWNYDDFAVGLQHSGSALKDTLRGLERSGLPTESSTVVGFGDDPAVRELLQVTRYLGSGGEHRDEILADHSALDQGLLEDIEAMNGLAAPLRRWATDSNLKHRIVDENDPLDARSQFSDVERVFRMASFVEDTAFIDTSWQSFADMLERAHEYAPQHNQTSATERDGGVQVDHVEAIKNGRYRAVFLLDLVDEEYPGDAWLTRLFPQERVAGMPDYPGVTNVDADDVEATFSTDSTESSRPLRRYYAELSRRRLASGAAAATDRLYCCLYEYEDTALEERTQASRFLADSYRTLSWITEAPDETIRSERAAEEYLLSRVDRALSDVRRSRSQDVTVALDDLEADLAEVHELLENSGRRGERLRDALHARVDFAMGEIRRE
ncbi:DNA helicase UvrD [Halosimplex sp. TS25]|uniref:DNA helicase UvrD n=1 Tax=Halosimplex rarum TaxID=3396619 RepID=UPI0039ED3AAA